MNGRYLFGLPFVTCSLDATEIECLVDTGFSGALALPLELVLRLGLKARGDVNYVMADGTSSRSRMFQGQVDWCGERKRVWVLGTASSLPLAGMGLLKDVRTVLDPSQGVLIIKLSIKDSEFKNN